MHELYEGIELDEAQTEAICRGLLDLAGVDGVHESETALIHEFYRTGGGVGDVGKLAEGDFDLAGMVKVLEGGGSAVVEAFVISCYLLIYADGQHSDAERKRIAEYASALGLDHDRLEALHVKARLYLLEMLAANLRNRDAIREVGTELGLSAEDIDDSLNKEG